MEIGPPGTNLPLGRAKALYMLAHGRNEIVVLPEVQDIDPNGSIGLELIDINLDAITAILRNKHARPAFFRKQGNNILGGMEYQMEQIRCRLSKSRESTQ